MTRGHRRVFAVIAATAAALIAAAPAAAATQRYASPTGSGAACTSGSPCNIETAFADQNLGDEIIVNPGDYDGVSQTLYAQVGSYAHGVYGQPAPRIHLTAAHYVVAVGAGSRISHLNIDGPDQPFEVSENAVADQLHVHGTAGSACLVYGTLTDSVCWTSSDGDEAVNGAGSATFAPVLRNVTAEATGANGIGIEYHSSSGGHFTITAVNTIAHGAEADIQLQAFLPDTTILNIDHSNYVHGSEVDSGAAINPTARQTQAPAFVNAAAGDFRQAPGSPTIDAGVNAAANGPFDYQGLPRVMGAATDIGASEHDPFAGVVLAQQKSKVKKRYANVAITCPAGVPSPCQGTLTLTFRQKKKTLTAGFTAFSIPSGSTGSASVLISKKASKRLAKKGRLATQATATATDGAGISGTAAAAVKLKSKKAKKKG